MSPSVYAPMLRNALKALAEETPPDPPDEWISKSRAVMEAADQSGVEIARRILIAKAAGEDLSTVPVERPWAETPFHQEMVIFLDEFDRYGRRFQALFQEMNQIKPTRPLSDVHFATVNFLRTEVLWARAAGGYYSETAARNTTAGQAHGQHADTLIDQMIQHHAVLVKALSDLERKHSHVLASMGLPADLLAQFR